MEELEAIKGNTNVFFGKKLSDLNLTDYYVLQNSVEQMYKIAKEALNKKENS